MVRFALTSSGAGVRRIATARVAAAAMTAVSREGTPVRILADDLTGALDAAGPFATCCGPVAVYWSREAAMAGGGTRIALDVATREADRDVAVERTRLAVRSLWVGGPGLAFKKVDSVWRGSPAAEVAAGFAAGAFERAVVAPAFPQQGRVTRGGAQWAAEGQGWRCVAPDIAAELRGFGIDADTEANASPSTAAIVCDAETPGDIDAIVARHWSIRARTLWCGTRGLANALAVGIASADGAGIRSAAPATLLRGPVLVVVGTDHPVSVEQARQLAALPGVVARTFGTAGGVPRTSEGVAPSPSAILWQFDVPAGTAREDARELIATSISSAVRRMPAPGLVVATGGETVRALGDALGAMRLDVLGEFEPGVPIAVWGDGRWAGTPALTKSGGFGGGALFARVVAALVDEPAA